MKSVSLSIRYSVVFFAAMLSLPVMAQDDSFTADRPGATTGTGIISIGRYQWETGVAYERQRDDDHTEHNYTLNTSLWRLGLSRHIELRVQTDVFLTHRSQSDNTCWGSLGVGTKMRLIDGHGMLPSVALLGNVSVPCGKKSDTQRRDFGFLSHALFESSLSDQWGLGCDVGLERSDDGSGCSAFIGACLSFQATDKLGLFVEEYNSLGDDTLSRIGTGVSCRLLPRLQLDASADANISHPSDSFIFSLGVAWQIN